MLKHKDPLNWVSAFHPEENRVFPSHRKEVKWKLVKRKWSSYPVFGAFLCCCTYLLSSHIICLHPALLLSSICLRSKRAVSHFVMSLLKSHFLSRNTLAEVCSAITCWIIRLSPTISWETRDGGPLTDTLWQLPATQMVPQSTQKYRRFAKKCIYRLRFISRSLPLATSDDAITWISSEVLTDCRSTWL